MKTDNLELAIRTKREDIEILSVQDQIGAKEALQIAMMELVLLEKSMPKEVIVKGLMQRYCPNCLNGNQAHEYCPYCGQHLKY